VSRELGRQVRDVIFDHISIAMHRLADAPAVLVAVLGGAADSGAPSRQFRWRCWRYAGGGRLEVIEPRGADGFLQRFLARRGPGIHHVTFKVPSLRAACDRAEALGYDIVEYDDSQPEWKEAFLHPSQALGIVVQLAEASGSDEALWPWKEPPPPEPPPPPVTVIGLRTQAVSPDRARRQWSELLGGVEAASPDGEPVGPGGGGRPGSGSGHCDRLLVFRWPGSPMRIAVEIAPPGVEEGPIGIEIASDRAITIPPSIQALVGARFLPLPAQDASSGTDGGAGGGALVAEP
jgi:catechol 2,3-dioxygenase-like lactoylglutathione lyase family enzyme